MRHPVQPPAKRPVKIIFRQSNGQIAEALTTPLDTSAEQMFRRQNPGR